MKWKTILLILGIFFSLACLDNNSSCEQHLNFRQVQILGQINFGQVLKYTFVSNNNTYYTTTVWWSFPLWNRRGLLFSSRIISVVPYLHHSAGGLSGWCCSCLQQGLSLLSSWPGCCGRQTAGMLPGYQALPSVAGSCVGGALWNHGTWFNNKWS